MMERVATRILDALDDVRWTKHEMDYLAWVLVHRSPQPMRRRLMHLSDAMIRHNYEMTEDVDDDTLF
jgi:hypothetical protein